MTRTPLLLALHAWARDRKPVLAALGFLFASLAILIIINVARG